MSIEYVVEGTKFGLSYTELQDKYHEFKEMSDQEFLDNIPKVLHLACVICFLKEIPTYLCLSDKGIIHELIHILDGNIPVMPLEDIRKLFNNQLELV